jgi:L-threonylcarbamoyladenylate synthase
MKPLKSVLLPAYEVVRDRPALERLLLPAAEALRRGQPVAFPTETVYGLGAAITIPEAIETVFRMKGRPNDNPLIVHVHDIRSIQPLVAAFSPVARSLAEAFMPGPLTLVLPRSERVPDGVTAGLNSVGIRIPESEIARTLIRLAGLPVAAPSANLSGHPSPTTAQHVLHDFAGQLSFVVDGGPCRVGLESTVLDLCAPAPVILRPGAVTGEEILTVLNEQGFEFPADNWRERLTGVGPTDEAAAESETPKAPGMKYRHYAPGAAVELFFGESAEERLKHLLEGVTARLSAPLPGDLAVFAGDEVIGGICAADLPVCCVRLDPDTMKTDYKPPFRSCDHPDRPVLYTYSYGTEGSVEAAARHLFDALRSLDELHPQVIFASALPDDRLGAAYMNRLRKAAGGTEEE